MVRIPDFVAIGHVTNDLLPGGGHRLGGAVTYAACTARMLGLRAAVLTSAPADLELDALLPGIALSVVPSPVVTTFENIYEGEARQQFLHQTAAVLKAEQLPRSWRRTPIAMLAPVAGEIGTDWFDAFPSALVGASPQGWMRDVDRAGRVRFKPWPAADRCLSSVEVLVFSEEDVGGSEAEIQHYAAMAAVTVVTRGSRGATVFCEGSSHEVAAFPVKPADATGAGDVFAAAFLVRLSESNDPLGAARFANCAASFAVQGHGIEAIPTRHQVEERLQEMAAAASSG